MKRIKFYYAREVIAEYKKQHDMSTVDLARKIGITPTFYYKVINGMKPMPMRALRVLVRLLGEDLEVFGLAFGFYPAEWIRFVQDNPVEVSEMINQTLEKYAVKRPISKTGDRFKKHEIHSGKKGGKR